MRNAANDGLKGVEGTFSICSFWLVDALTRAGKLEEARQNLEQMLTYANHLGLYSEEIGPLGEGFGNFPQAFTHLALISACHALDQALGGDSSTTSKDFSNMVFYDDVDIWRKGRKYHARFCLGCRSTKHTGPGVPARSQAGIRWETAMLKC